MGSPGVLREVALAVTDMDVTVSPSIDEINRTMNDVAALKALDVLIFLNSRLPQEISMWSFIMFHNTAAEKNSSYTSKSGPGIVKHSL